MPANSDPLRFITQERVDVTGAVEEAFTAERTDLENQAIRDKNRSFRQDTNERKKYAHRIFCLAAVWLIFVSATIVCAGTGRVGWMPFYLANSVQIALLTTSMATVIGVLLIVANYLFPRQK